VIAKHEFKLKLQLDTTSVAKLLAAPALANINTRKQAQSSTDTNLR